jgi:hypothetical protein
MLSPVAYDRDDEPFSGHVPELKRKQFSFSFERPQRLVSFQNLLFI